MYKIIVTVLLILQINTSAQNLNVPLTHLLDSVSKDNIKTHLEELGSDKFMGRGTGQLGGELSAEYIAQFLKSIDIIPFGDNNTYFQKIPMHGSTVSPESQLLIISSNDTTKLEYGEDYFLYKAGEQTFTPNPLEIVFVGYGIIAPEFDYNDYQNLDVENKIVVFLSGEPKSVDNDYFNGKEPTVYSAPEAKQRIAAARGASGSILIADKSTNWERFKIDFSFEDVSLAYSTVSKLNILMNRKSFQNLFTGFNFEDHSSRSLNSELLFRGVFNEREFISSNIIGLIPGAVSNLKDEYLILSAHYDHLGIGEKFGADSIYNGVLDNAIGVSGLLELSRIINDNREKFKRSIILLFTTGEEKGLLGSSFYTENPKVPLYKTIANINIDGLAYLDEFNSIIGIGGKYSDLDEYVEEAAEISGLETTDIPYQFAASESFNRSDQIAFAKEGIPSILIYEGLDFKNLSYNEAFREILNYQNNIYHTPFDDLSIPINYNAVSQHLRVILALTHILADSEKAPEWKEGSSFINKRLQTKAEKR